MRKLIELLCIVSLMAVLVQSPGDASAITNVARQTSARCPQPAPAGNPAFHGVIFYETNDGHTSTVWRLTPDLLSEPVVTASFHEAPSDGVVMRDKLAVMTYSYPGFGVRRYRQGILVLNRQWQMLHNIPWHEDWTDFYGWTSDDRLVIGHRSTDLSQNGLLLVDLDGHVTTYFDLPNAADPIKKDTDYWESVDFYVSPNVKQAAYDADFPSARGLIVADLTTGAEVWRTEANDMDYGVWPGVWTQAMWALDGTRFVYSRRDVGRDPEIALVDAQGNERILTNMNAGMAAADRFFTQDSAMIWNSRGDSVSFWKFYRYRVNTVVPVGTPPLSGELTLLDIGSGRIRGLCLTRLGPVRVYWSPDDSALIVGHIDTINLIDLKHNISVDLPVNGQYPNLLGWMNDN